MLLIIFTLLKGCFTLLHSTAFNNFLYSYKWLEFLTGSLHLKHQVPFTSEMRRSPSSSRSKWEGQKKKWNNKTGFVCSVERETHSDVINSTALCLHCVGTLCTPRRHVHGRRRRTAQTRTQTVQAKMAVPQVHYCALHYSAGWWMEVWLEVDISHERLI